MDINREDEILIGGKSYGKTYTIIKEFYKPEILEKRITTAIKELQEICEKAAGYGCTISVGSLCKVMSILNGQFDSDIMNGDEMKWE